MPTDLEVAEAEAEEERRSRRKPRSRAGLFLLVLMLFLTLAVISAFFSGDASEYPWFAYKEGTIVETVDHPHLRGTVYRVNKSHDDLRDDIFDRQGFTPASGLSFQMQGVMLGLRGMKSRVKVPSPVKFGWQSTLILERYRDAISFALMLGSASNRVSQLQVFEHSVNPEAGYHTTTITGDSHLFPAIRAVIRRGGGTFGITAATYDCTNSLATVQGYYEKEFKPTPAVSTSTSAALWLSSAPNATTSHYTLLIQGTAGLIMVHVVEDPATKQTQVSVVEVSP